MSTPIHLQFSIQLLTKIIPAMSTLQEAFTIFDIPEVIDGLGRHLDQHTLTTCLRVNQTWYKLFLPQLWRNIHVYDFNYNHTEHCYIHSQHKEADRAQDGKFYEYVDDGQPWHAEDNFHLGDWPPVEWPKRLCCIQDVMEPLEGHHHADKFSHWIRAITIGSDQSVLDLGLQCVNLEYLEFDSDAKRYGIQFDSTSGIFEWVYEKPGLLRSRVNEIWLDVLKRNPKLKVVKIPLEFSENTHLHKEILEALANLKGLEELYLWGGMMVPDWVQVLRSRCGSLRKVVTANNEQNLLVVN